MSEVGYLFVLSLALLGPSQMSVRYCFPHSEFSLKNNYTGSSNTRSVAVSTCSTASIVIQVELMTI